MVNSPLGLLALLDDQDHTLITYALTNLNQLVHQLWPDLPDHLVRIESLSEHTSFSHSTLAALLASKVYYHLGNLDEALTFALTARDLFNPQHLTPTPEEQEYIDTIISKAIDAYVIARSAHALDQTHLVDPRLESTVERMFERCEQDGEYKQALGISLSSHRLDVIERVFNKTKDASLLEWVLQVVVREGVVAGSGTAYKSQLLRLLIKLFTSLPSPDYFSITQCFVYLNDPALASELLSSLLSLGVIPVVEPKEEMVLIAYQIAFDLAETAGQGFLQVVRNELSGPNPTTTTEGEAMVEDGVGMYRQRVVAILTGEESIKLYLEFLYKNNHTDLLILKGTKDALESRNSIFHSAVSFMNAFANAGTTSDLFLRENLDWLAKASNWSKFSATAALGVIHKGNLTQGMEILEPYLPKPQGGSTSFYSEGGSLFGLGLVHANHGSGEVLSFLKEGLKGGENANEVIQHGAALGLGVAAMGSGNEEIYEELRNVLFNDSAIAGEAAGYAMGLVLLGTGSQKALDEMLQYAHETQHEKIIRGLAVGIALLMYGKEEEADGLIDTLLGDADAILRYGGIYTIAMAYAGTGNNTAIKRLLHVAVSDVNDDVRRAAVTSLGFILFRNPTQVPRIVQLLAESYNPNVRYGAALALGISCAGTGSEPAIELLKPLTKDPIDFVRQGACLSLSMILIQHTTLQSPHVQPVREIFSKIISDKHEDGMAKFGATLAQGIIDAGGRNVSLTLRNKNGLNNVKAIIGFALFNQFWYWFPMTHFLSLAFTPTAIIGLNKDLLIPKFDFISNAKPSLFAYPPATKVPEKEVVEKVKKAVLSTTAKAVARAKIAAKAKEGDENGDEMQMDEKVEIKDEEMKLDETATPTTIGIKTKSRKPEPSSDRLSNLSRVTPAQLGYISFPPESRYIPVRPLVTSSLCTTSPTSREGQEGGRMGGGGILMMRDLEPEKEAIFLEIEVTKVLEGPIIAAPNPATGVTGEGGARGPIASMPPAFEYENFE